MAKTKTRRFRYRPRYRGYRRYMRNKQVPVLPLLGLGAGLIAPAQLALSGDYAGALAETGARYTGYNFQSKQFDFMYALMNGWLPFLAGVVGHYVANKVGLNRHIKKLPFVGKYVAL
jgi:hypothetical protein